MKTRVITAAVMVAAMIPFFWFSDTVLFPILAAFLSCVGMFEMLRCVGEHKNPVFLVLSFAVGAGLPFYIRYVGTDLVFTAFFILAVGELIAALFSKGKTDPAVSGLISTATVYICFGISSLVLLRDMKNGIYLVFLPFVISWMTDTFAYFCGRAFGKHKLIPDVSPKKTVEGSVGGTLCAVLITALYAFLMGSISDLKVSYVSVVIVALVASLLSQCGDLIMSLIKRKYGIKDYGKLFPGHGGVLDRFDSIIITAPFIYILCTYVPFINFFE